jgi:hypothetical protein
VRGVRALRQAPLIVVLVILGTCRLDLHITKPEVEVSAQVAYQSANSITIDFKFTADEPTLRCRYSVTAAGVAIQSGVTEKFTPGTWQKVTISLNAPDGAYTAELIAQAERGEGYVDLPFLSTSVDFFLDTKPPNQPAIDHLDVTLYGFHLYLKHPELSGTGGTPVEIRYTLGDGSLAPDKNSILYDPAEGIVVPLDEWELKLRAIAFDEALNQSAELVLDPVYTDVLNPVMPKISLPSGLYSENKEVSLTHDEWDSPLGSLVRIYYTTNGEDPSASLPAYIAETKIPITMSADPVVFKAIAVDDSGRSSAVKTETYNFINIDHMHSNSDTGPLNTFNTGFSPQWIYLHGFGLANVVSASFKDADGTNALTTAIIEPTSSTQVILAVSINTDGTFSGDGTTTDGILRLIDASGTSDEIAIDLDP